LIEIFPIILVIIGWNLAGVDAPLALQHSLHPGEESCQKRGAEFLAERKLVRGEAMVAQFRYFCIPAPSPYDARGAFEQPE
jgi:hypothetical protein